MNAVNLLPAKHRPRTPTGGQQGSSYVVIGVLGGLLVMVLLYALTVNGVNSKKASIARTNTETAQAKKRAEELTPYGNFIQVKEQRVASVKSLATGRIDWERLALGLAHVLPEHVWLQNASASASGDPGASGGGAPAAPAAPAPAPAAPGGAPAAPATPAAAPKMILKGCAGNHNLIAVTLVRLRHLPAVSDVELVSATKPDEAPQASTAPGAPPAPNESQGSSGDDCGTVAKEAALQFEVTVSFKPQAGSDPQQVPGQKPKVPTSLGGGA
ncbi:MAG TPA: hypothetical protein VF715_00085 [Thermoleophilaceae bacterium]|jgi:hypothetical protein